MMFCSLLESEFPFVIQAIHFRNAYLCNSKNHIANMDTLLQYFPDLSPMQQEQFAALGELYKEWNQKINVISRKDIDNVYAHHILHSLAITKMIHFVDGTEVLDLGTGGGLPGIPLAIFFPEAYFTLVDGRKKKAQVTTEIVQALGLQNAIAMQARGEELKRKFDFVVCRAVASIDKLKIWTQKSLKEEQYNTIPNGLIALKGGDVKKEIKLLPHYEFVETFNLKDYFDLPYYEEKHIIYVQG